MKTKKWKPKQFDICFVPDIFSVNEDSMYDEIVWYNQPRLKEFYKKGLVCESSSEAIELAKAMLKVAERRMK